MLSKLKLPLLLITFVSFIYMMYTLSLVKKNSVANSVSQNPIMENYQLKVNGWIPYWDQAQAFQSFSAQVDLFDYLGLFWYRLDEDGNITTYTSTIEDFSIVNFAHQNNVKVLPIIANLPDYQEGGTWDPDRARIVISTDASRQKHVSQITSLVLENEYDGITIDYEALKQEDKENFTNFITKLAGSLHANGKLLGVGIHPKTSDNNPGEDNGSHAQDYTQLAQSADHLYFMTYTQSSLLSQPGPAGSLPWAQKVINYALAQRVPREKIFFGIGLFGLEWEKQDQSYIGLQDDLTYREIMEITDKYQTETVWDNETKNSYLAYSKNGSKHLIWYDNYQAIAERIAYAQSMKLGGISFWRLGGEDQGIWDLLR